MSIGEIIREFRLRQNLSQRQFAIKVGVSNNYIANLEKGKATKPSVETIKMLASAMDMTTNDLLSLMGDTVVSLEPDEYVANMTRQLRENPKLRLLFDKSSKMTDADMDAVIGIVNALVKERDGDDD